MSDRKRAKPAEASGTEVTRFNALRHGVLSRYTVLPVGGRGRIPRLGRRARRRARTAGTDRGASGRGTGRDPLAQAPAAPGGGRRPSARGLDVAPSQPRSDTAKSGGGAARLRSTDLGTPGRPSAPRLTDTEDAVREREEDEAMTAKLSTCSARAATTPTRPRRLREDTQQWWAGTKARDHAELEEDEEPFTAEDSCRAKTPRARPQYATTEGSGSLGPGIEEVRRSNPLSSTNYCCNLCYISVI